MSCDYVMKPVIEAVIARYGNNDYPSIRSPRFYGEISSVSSVKCSQSVFDTLHL